MLFEDRTVYLRNSYIYTSSCITIVLTQLMKNYVIKLLKIEEISVITKNHKKRKRYDTKFPLPKYTIIRPKNAASPNKDKSGRNSGRLKCKNAQHCNFGYNQSLSTIKSLIESLLSFLFSQKISFLHHGRTLSRDDRRMQNSVAKNNLYLCIPRSKRRMKRDGWTGGREKRVFWVETSSDEDGSHDDATPGTRNGLAILDSIPVGCHIY